MKIIKLPALKKQVGGNHYKAKHYELAQFSLDLGLNAMVHSAIKYVLRDKDDRTQDLEKAIHCLEIFKDWVYISIQEKKLPYTNMSHSFSFEAVAEFTNQFDPHIAQAITAILKLQSECLITMDISEDFETAYDVDWNQFMLNFDSALEMIDRLK